MGAAMMLLAVGLSLFFGAARLQAVSVKSSLRAGRYSPLMLISDAALSPVYPRFLRGMGLLWMLCGMALGILALNAP